MNSKPLVVAKAITPPAERLVCADEARVPAGEFTDAVVADYIVRLAASGQDCRSKVKYLRDWFNTLNAK